MTNKAIRANPEEWKETSLEDYIKIKHGYAFKGEHFSDTENEYILLTPGNFKIGGGFKSDKFKFYEGNVPLNYILDVGDLIISMTDLSKSGDTLGFPAVIPKRKSKNFLHNQRLGKVEFLNKNLDKKFLYWLMCSRNYQRYIVNSASGSTVRHTSPSKIQEYSFLLPPFRGQKAIAGVLSSFDDKIELLREQNKTLEATAQAIFKEWFIDFEFPIQNQPSPDLSQRERRKTYRSSGGKMIDSELGETPNGWRKGKLGEVLSLEYGKPMKEEDRTGKGFPVFGSNGIVGYHEVFLVKGDGIVVGRKGTMGSVVWVEGNFYPIDTAFYVQDKLGVDKLFFHYLLLLKQNFEKVGSDSAVPGLNRNSAYAIEIVIPEVETINYFHKVIEPIFSKIKLNNFQIQTLSNIRDSLIPKLMTGKIRVSNIKVKGETYN